MHYFIDGYNLLFSREKKEKDLKSQRERLIKDIAEVLSVDDVMVVFDAHEHPDTIVRCHYKHLEIRYTATGVTADDVIIEELSRSRSMNRELVVTSDCELAWRARCHGARTISCELFYESMEKKAAKRERSFSAVRSRSSVNMIKKNGQQFQKEKMAEDLQGMIPTDSTIYAPFERFNYYLTIFEERYEHFISSKNKR